MFNFVVCLCYTLLLSCLVLSFYIFFFSSSSLSSSSIQLDCLFKINVHNSYVYNKYKSTAVIFIYLPHAFERLYFLPQNKHFCKHTQTHLFERQQNMKHKNYDKFFLSFSRFFFFIFLQYNDDE